MQSRGSRLITLCGLTAVLGSLALGAGAQTAGDAARERQPVPLSGSAPELVGGSWLNTEKNAPLTLAALRGKVTILHFWTFG